jgi:hypothetical protein
MQIVARMLEFDSHTFAAQDAITLQAPYMLAGRQMYALGLGSAEIGSIGREHLIGKMGGIWAHPVRVADGLAVEVTEQSAHPAPSEGATFIERLHEVAWVWRIGACMVERCDKIIPDQPVYTSRVTLHNTSLQAVAFSVVFTAHLNFLGCWFSGITVAPPAYRISEGVIEGEPGNGWGVAFGGLSAGQATIEQRGETLLAQLHYSATLAPDERLSYQVMLAVAHEGGAATARATLAGALNTPLQPCERVEGRPLPCSAAAVSLQSSASDLVRDFALAQVNLHMLEVSYPTIGAYFLAGLPEYPQLFGCDTTYSVPGTLAAGFAATTEQALRTLGQYAQRACARVPHEITTNGRVFNPGNIQETPQFVIACWDYVRWTGDLAFARELFPLCREGMLELVPAHCGPGGRYPLGDAMVERLGMGAHKLDSACYTIAGLHALSKLATLLGEPYAPLYAERAEALNAAFEQDWWMEDEGLYADSMHSDGRLQLDGHWTAVLPVQLGIADPERARRVLEHIERDYVNEWGLVHTRVREELVWTLPTGLLALTYFANGRPAAGLKLAQHIALTAQHGTMGTFKELIPEGLCFVQLWSAALYIQIIVEGLLGIQPDAPAHALTIAPCMPADHPPVTLRGLRVGAHMLDLTISPAEVHVFHTEGPQPVRIAHRNSAITLPAGSGQVWKGGDGSESRE